MPDLREARVEIGPKLGVVLPRFPEEVAAIAELHLEAQSFSGNDALDWGIEEGVLEVGQVSTAEVSPTLRCPMDCAGCPDARSSVKKAIDAGTIDRVEERADLQTMVERLDALAEMGVRHVMNIGGTIDKNDNLVPLIREQQRRGFVVSWFTDGIPQLDVDGKPTELLERNLEDGWVRDVATHVSTDYVFGECDGASDSLFADEVSLPPMRGKNIDATDYSRRFKSQYSAVMAKTLIEEGARRVVVNMTISHSNADQVSAIYEQAVALQDYADQVGSTTEVLFTFSPWVWRAHQARGDAPEEHSPEDGLWQKDMPGVNDALRKILNDTYERLDQGRPRILANSSGYTHLHTERAFRDEAVEQDVGYVNGRPLMLSVSPSGDVALDSMFAGPELPAVRNTFGYMDREPDSGLNPFAVYHHNNRPYLPNLTSLASREEPQALPSIIADHRLARLIDIRDVIRHSDQHMRNKSDSPHTMGDPRRLGSNPHDLVYVAQRILHIAQTECEGNLLLGLASFGLGLAAVASALSADTDQPMRFAYVKLSAEEWKGKQQVEGDYDPDNDVPILVDDLLFHSTTTRQAVEIIRTGGPERLPFRYPVKHIIHLMNRQLQRVDDGPSLEQDGFRHHSVITMQDIIAHRIQQGTITPQQLEDVIGDYRMHARHDMPEFAR